MSRPWNDGVCVWGVWEGELDSAEKDSWALLLRSGTVSRQRLAVFPLAELLGQGKSGSGRWDVSCHGQG